MIAPWDTSITGAYTLMHPFQTHCQEVTKANRTVALFLLEFEIFGLRG